MAVRDVYTCLCLGSLLIQSVQVAGLEVTVQTDRVVSVTSERFVSITLDAGNLVNHWKGFDPRSSLAIRLARALYPAYLRVGGTPGDSLIFSTGNKHQDTNFPNCTLSTTTWDELNQFATQANLSLIFGLNSLYRSGTAWDPANAIELMKYSADKGYVLDLELGNGYFNFSSSYYMNGHEAKAADFIDASRLDSFIPDMTEAQEILRNLSHGTQKFWVGETSSAYGGGVSGVSDTFIAGFMWLDKLGLAAYYGTEVVLRQAFVGGHYGLLDYSNGVFSVNPDYWLTVLYKNLVGQIVLSTGIKDEKLRIYSHCTSSRSGYGLGAITFYAMNLYNTSMNMSFPQFRGIDLHVYELTSGDDTTLVSRKVNLNGKPLELISGQLPPLPPKIVSSEVPLPPFSFAFIVVPNSGAAACMGT
ncbi:heparanase-like [Liolophura sinensis]|uniref:heparanase-like n=1 Tax=Liolophura sinensis TaxID=3198878 RepID=UPI00315835B9